MNLHQAIERVIFTHQIPREKVVGLVGEISTLDADSCRRLLVDLADGVYGGISEKPPQDAAHPLQTVHIYRLARSAFGPSFMPRLRNFILTTYPEKSNPRDLTRRQSTRIIIELDSKVHPDPRST